MVVTFCPCGAVWVMLQYATNLIKCKKETEYFLRPITAATINKKKTLNLEGRILVRDRRVQCGSRTPSIRGGRPQNDTPKTGAHSASFLA